MLETIYRAIDRDIQLNDNKGVVAIIVAILIFVLFGMAALAVDIGHLAVVKNELQNAADAGALTGKDIISIGGTGKGADAALVLKPAGQSHFFDMHIKEIICKPSI